MKRLFMSALIISLFVVAASVANAQCVKIKDGTVTDSDGNKILPGYDQFGYNYQAHMFNGTYDSSDRTLDGAYWGITDEFSNDKLIMKWSDEWLSNQSCDGNFILDRGGLGGDGTSKGWLTNHVEGDYIKDGDSHHYTYFVKIVYIQYTNTSPDPWAENESGAIPAIM
jgi:hypothetical protein